MTEADWLEAERVDSLLDFVKHSVSGRKLRLFACACCRPLLAGVQIPGISLNEKFEAAERFAEGLLTVPQLIAHFPGNLLEDPPDEFYTIDAVGQRTWQAVFALGWSPIEGPNWMLNQDHFTASSFPPSPLYVPCPWPPGEYAVERTDFAVGLAAQAWALLKSGCPYPGSPDSYGPWRENAGVPEYYFEVEKERHITFASILREIVDNPFRPAVLDHTWLTSDVVAIAESVYAERAITSGDLELARLAVLADALEDAGCNVTEILTHLRSAGPHVRGCWAVDMCLSRL